MVSDPIADMLTRIRNAGLAKLSEAKIPASGIKKELARILSEEGYIDSFKLLSDFPESITVRLKYDGDRRSAIAGLKRTSRPGRRVYVGHGDVPRVNNGLGVAVLSTSKGVMTDREARRQRVGGEVLCEIW